MKPRNTQVQADNYVSLAN